MTFLEDEPDDADRDGRGDDHPAHPVVQVVAFGLVEDPGEPGGEDHPDVFGEEHQDRQFSAQLNHGGEGCAGVLAPDQLGDDAHVS